MWRTMIEDYQLEGFYDEMFAAPGRSRRGAEFLVERLSALGLEELRRRQQIAEQALVQAGITFRVYGRAASAESIWPFDIIPRIVVPEEWARLERGLKQRITALNLFLQDVYGRQAIVRDGVIPAYVIESAASFRPQCVGLHPPGGVWNHITGTDVVRHDDGRFYVLEDNLRCPSGVSYVLGNRDLMKRTVPQAFQAARVFPVEEYPNRLLGMLHSLAPAGVSRPNVVLLTPGTRNSAYFEHSFLAQQMGIHLVEGRDLVVSDGCVMMRTTGGLQRVDVIYRRVDDDFLDPQVFRPDSMLGVRGLLDVYRAGRVAVANAPGCGVADDKVVYAYVPDMIRFYLAEDPILPNVPTYLCWIEEQRRYVLEHLDTLVVKSANESGGYGMLIGPKATAAERDELGQRILESPRNFIAQPTLALSRVPTITPDGIEGRHVDLRPFVLLSPDQAYVLPGGLTRVALRRGSLVVNSSQGGGSKDTWVMAEMPGGAPC